MKKLINSAALLIGLGLIALAFLNSSDPPDNPSPVAQSDLWEVKPGSVYDGDTLRVLKSGQELKIRFACVDAMEIKQEGGIESRDYLRSLLENSGNRVKLNITNTDRYGRSVAEVSILLGGKWEIVQELQARNGWVWAYGRYQSDCPSWSAISVAEQQAKSEKIGIWANEEAISPWKWRQQN